ncbi:MAG TPA: hypothetical protein VFI02_13505 [Armatimonadota bacterium]|nr:hypothetical protein [Armatimonadota bacterium]
MTLLIVFVGVIAFCNFVVLVGTAVALFALKRLIDKPVRQAVCEAKNTIHNVNKLVDTVEDRTGRILDISEQTARKVSGNVMATSEVVKETITSPLISFSSLVAGISEAVQSCRRAS